MTVYEQALNHANKCRKLIEEASKNSEPIKEITCSVCGKTKPQYKFYTYANGKYYGHCKECHLNYVKHRKERSTNGKNKKD